MEFFIILCLLVIIVFLILIFIENEKVLDNTLEIGKMFQRLNSKIIVKNNKKRGKK